MIFDDKRGLLPELTPENIQKIKTHPYYAECMNSVREKCDVYLTSEPARIKYSEMHVYFDTSSRKPFEAIYHDYESRLCNFLFILYIDPVVLPQITNCQLDGGGSMLCCVQALRQNIAQGIVGEAPVAVNSALCKKRFVPVLQLV